MRKVFTGNYGFAQKPPRGLYPIILGKRRGFDK